MAGGVRAWGPTPELTQRRCAGRPRIRPAQTHQAVLGLQRSIGNRAVARLIRSGRRLQRLTEDEVRDAADYSGDMGALSDAVVKRIAKITTEWENAGAAPVWRHRDLKAALDALFQSPEYFAKSLPKPDDPDHWAGIVSEVMAKLYAPKVKGQQAPLTEPVQMQIPLHERWTIHCTMGQAVTANLARYTLFSDQFSSCSPVVLFNRETLSGGLMHYGAGSPTQKSELGSMYAKIAPTDIYLNWRLSGTGSEIDRDDFDELTSFFEDELKSKADIHDNSLQSNLYYVYLDEKGGLKVDSQQPATAGTFDATNITKGTSLNKQVDLLVNEKVYTKLFATGNY